MATIRRYFGVIGLCAAALFAPQIAHATGEACTNDIDCKTGPTCGGEICDWTQGMTCHPATTAGSGKEGWCSADTDCKCASEGATCDKSMFQCTKTTAGAAGGTGGASGTAGGAGASSAGTASSSAGTASAGTSSSSDDSSGSSGCSVGGGVPRGSLGIALGAVCAAALVGARRRRRAA